MISAVVLAAGTASRFGSTKQLVLVDGKPLVQHAIDAAAAAELDEIVVVLGHDADQVREALELPSNARAVVNDRYAQGQSTSLAAGLFALDPSSEAAVVLLGDQPEVRPEEIRALIERFAETRASTVRLRYRNAPGPALLGREIWPDALKLRGDTGARALFDSHEVDEVEIDRDVPRDIDRPADMRSSSRPD
ncbi:MAG TPA: nucleotidyltransferase family protein [Actinomycetota bacterium]